MLRIFFSILILTFNLFAKDKIYVYSDSGAGPECVRNTIYALTIAIEGKYKIRQISAADIIADKLSDAVLLVMPGGADLPYCEKLNGAGNAKIRTFVAAGGAYLGICAGAYYGSAFCEFDKGGPLEVCGKRELAFFDGKAVGPILAPYDYRSHAGARAADIDLCLDSDGVKSAHLYYNGGCAFLIDDSDKSVCVLGRYAALKDTDKPDAAIVETSFGEGRIILSGVHFEYNSDSINTDDEHLRRLKPILKDSERFRRILFKALLSRLIGEL